MLLFLGIHNPIEKSLYGTNEGAVGYSSKSREVSPKLVVAGKKYGRRSRPQSVAFDSLHQSDSDESDHSTNEKKSNSKSQTVSTIVKFRLYVRKHFAIGISMENK